MNSTIVRVSLVLGILALTGPAGFGCGGGRTCGPGTVAQDGVCVPLLDACDPGTVLDEASGECVSACADGQYWDGAACADEPDCDPGTVFDPQTATCRPACPDGQTWDGSQCIDAPTCGPGTVFDPTSGNCVPGPDSCAAGTVWENGQCQPDLQCGPGTHQENGACLPDSLPDPDVVESSDPDQAALFDLPAAGAEIHLGGVVDTPVDGNGDGYPEGDWDAFAFQAPAGTYLRIRATSAGAALPAFALWSASEDADGNAVFARYAIEPNALALAREIFLPIADTYILMVSDYNNMMTDMFGYGFIPVGGDDFSYLVTVENLGDPEIVPVDSLPLHVENDLDQGRLYFYLLPGVLARDILTLSASGNPPEGSESDLFCALMVFAPDGSFLADAWGSRYEPTEVVLAAQADGDYLLVQDHAVALGPNRGARLDVDLPTIEDCTAGGCGDGALAEGEARWLRWDLAVDDFFLFAATVPADATENLGVWFYDRFMQPISEASAGATWNRWDHQLAQTDTWVYLKLGGWFGGAVPSYTLAVVHEALAELQPGLGLTGLGVLDMPAETIADCGLSFFSADADLLAVSLLSGASGAWTEPAEEFYTAELAYLGPALWNNGNGFDPVAPAVAYIRQAGTYLHAVSDRQADVVGDTYDADLALLSVSTMGAPDAGNPVSEAAQSLDPAAAMAAYMVSATDQAAYTIVVTPDGNAQLEVQVLEFGWHYNTTWYDNPTSAELGLLTSGTGAHNGAAVTLNVTAHYDGGVLILVRDPAGPNANTFSIEVSLD